MVGEKRENRFICYTLICKRITPLLNTTLLSHFYLGWEILCLSVNQTTLKVFSQFLGISLGQLSPNHLQCRYVFKRTVKKTIHLKTFVSINVDHP